MAGSIKDLSKYRYERASEELENAKLMLDNGKYKLALNRSYYSIFHDMQTMKISSLPPARMLRNRFRKPKYFTNLLQHIFRTKEYYNE